MAGDADKEEPPSLDAFSKRLERMRAQTGRDRGADTAGPNAGRNASTGAAWGRAVRLSSELVAGLLVGTLLGVGLDRAFGSAPWFLLIGIGIGFAAGMRNLSRAVGDANEAPPSPHTDDDGADDNNEAQG